MTYKSSVTYAWSLFLGILAAELVIDYIIRSLSNDFRYSGIPEPIWFFIHIMAAGISGFFIFRGLRYLDKVRYKTIHLLVNLILGALIYILITGIYILGLGIDSL